MKQEVKDEINKVIDEASQKFGYNETDTKTKSLSDILKEIVPCILDNSDEESRNLFYNMLRCTPIIITENQMSEEIYKEIYDKQIGKVNEHIIEEEENLGEYSKKIAPAAYVSEPIINSNMKVDGKKSFIYVEKLSGYKEDAIETLGTDINIAYLIHELGHAWNAEKDEYKMTEDGKLIRRVGTSKFISSFKKDEVTGKYIKSLEEYSGLYLEEAINTECEEQAMARFLNIDRNDLDEFYKQKLTKSTYQGSMSGIARALLERTDQETILKWRQAGDSIIVENIEERMQQTDYWNKLKKQTSYENKRFIFEKTKKDRIQDFFKEYEQDFFPDTSKFTPMNKIDNVLSQLYNFKAIQYQFDIMGNDNERENYNEIMTSILSEGYVLINQTRDIISKENEKYSIGDIAEITKNKSITQINNITQETKKGIKSKDKEDPIFGR